MRYLLDANIIIRAFTAENAPLLARLAAHDEGEIVTSAIAYAEVVLGSTRGKPPSPPALAGFLEEVAVLDFDQRAADAYARLPFRRASFDRLIAAHALSAGLVLVTDNDRDFADVPDLRTKNWILPL